MLPRKRNGVLALAAIVLGGLLLRLALLPVPGEPGDVATFAGWTKLIVDYGTHGLYTHVEPFSGHVIDYPPGYALVLALIARVYSVFFLVADRNEIILRALLKIPAILADLGLCVLAFAVVRRWGSLSHALQAAAMVAFVPTAWLISAYWGQVDSVSAVLLLLAITLMLYRHYTLAWCALALAVLVKPQPIVIAPLLLAYQIRDEGVSGKLAIGPLSAVPLAYLLALPFAATASPLPSLLWLLARYRAAVALNPYTSVSACNMYTLFGQRFTPDDQLVLGTPIWAWGMLAFGTLAIGVVLILIRAFAEPHDRVDREKILVTACFIVLTGLFVLTTRMHERYLFSAIALAPLVWFADSGQRYAAVSLIITFIVNCALDLFGLFNIAHHGIGLVILVVSATNVATFAALVYRFASAPRLQPIDRLVRG